MKTEHLHDLWAGPDNTRLTSKQVSLRLPTHIAAKVAALCEMYPQKNRTQIIADLLTASLNDLEASLPEMLGERLSPSEQAFITELEGERAEGKTYYYLGGPRAQFRKTSNRHYLELEKELGNDEAKPLYSSEEVITEEYLDKKGKR